MLKELLSLATKNSHLIFDGILYKQIDGVAMGTPLGATLANGFFVYQKNNRLERCSLKYIPFYYQRYFKVIFAFFNSPEHLKRFQSYLNSCHVNISLTIEMKMTT